jgi:hypothetical protein
MTWINPATIADSSGFDRRRARNFALCKQTLLLSLTASGVTYQVLHKPLVSSAHHKLRHSTGSNNTQQSGWKGTLRRDCENAIRELRCVLVESQMPLTLTPGSPSRSLSRLLSFKVALGDVTCLPLFLVTSQRESQAQISMKTRKVNVRTLR